jgi:hypothetical protein
VMVHERSIMKTGRFMRSTSSRCICAGVKRISPYRKIAKQIAPTQNRGMVHEIGFFPPVPERKSTSTPITVPLMVLTTMMFAWIFCR